MTEGKDRLRIANMYDRSIVKEMSEELCKEMRLQGRIDVVTGLTKSLEASNSYAETFWGDMSGQELRPELVKIAREEEVQQLDKLGQDDLFPKEHSRHQLPR